MEVIKPNFKKICLMHLQQLTNFPYIEKDFDALTDYELLCKVVDYLNKVIANENEQNEVVTSLYNAFIELKNYVENYFENLDVQDEINNKLDEMVEDGTLERILTNYIHIEKIYATFTELYNDTNVSVNQKVKCLGMNEINDGDGGEFIITSDNGVPLSGGLYALPLSNYQENFYNEITFVKERHYDTDCYITTIPLNDNDNKQIDLYVAKNENTQQSPLKYAQDNLTTLTINASLWIKNTEDESKSGDPVIIGNGEILNNNSMYGETGVADNYLYLGITEDRTIKEFKVNNTTAEQLLAAGCVNVFNCYYKLIENYFPLDLTNVVTNEDGIVTGYHPRQVLCEMEDKSLLILTCDGRTMESRGLTSTQLQNILVEKRVRNAWNLDGGGSASTNIKTVKINRHIDDSFKTDRPIPYTLNVKKLIKNKNIANVYPFVSEMLDLYNYKYQQDRIRMHNLREKDANNLIGELYFGFGTLMTNTPINTGYFINLSDTITTENRWLYNKQIFISGADNDNKRIWARSMVNGEWTEWYDIQDGVYRILIHNNNYIIQQTNTYEVVPIDEVYSLTPFSDIIKLNDDNTFSFTKLSTKLLFIQCVISGKTAGNIYIKVQEDDDVILLQNTYHTGSLSEPTQLTLICPLIANNLNTKYKILAYGPSETSFTQFYAYIK